MIMGEVGLVIRVGKLDVEAMGGLNLGLGLGVGLPC